jgi:hypothetical protein
MHHKRVCQRQSKNKKKFERGVGRWRLPPFFHADKHWKCSPPFQCFHPAAAKQNLQLAQCLYRVEPPILLVYQRQPRLADDHDIISRPRQEAGSTTHSALCEWEITGRFGRSSIQPIPPMALNGAAGPQQTSSLDRIKVYRSHAAQHPLETSGPGARLSMSPIPPDSAPAH